MAVIFVEKNINPKNKKTTDCVIRAIGVAENMEWKGVLMDLINKYSLKYCLLPTDKKCFQKYLKDLGYEKLKMPKDENGKKVRIKNYKFDLSKTYIIGVNHHLTCFKNGCLIDSWNCQEYCITNLWVK